MRSNYPESAYLGRSALIPGVSRVYNSCRSRREARQDAKPKIGLGRFLCYLPQEPEREGRWEAVGEAVGEAVERLMGGSWEAVRRLIGGCGRLWEAVGRP